MMLKLAGEATWLHRNALTAKLYVCIITLPCPCCTPQNALDDLHTQFCHSSYRAGWKLWQNTIHRLICFASSNNETYLDIFIILWYKAVLFTRNWNIERLNTDVYTFAICILSHGDRPIVYCQLTAWPHVQVPPMQLGNIRCTDSYSDTSHTCQALQGI